MPPLIQPLDRALPLQPARRPAATSVFIFTSIALWNDPCPRLLGWGWLAAPFILPEVVARNAFPPSLFRDGWWYLHAARASGVLNVLLMTDAGWYFTHELISSLVVSRLLALINVLVQEFAPCLVLVHFCLSAYSSCSSIGNERCH